MISVNDFGVKKYAPFDLTELAKIFFWCRVPLISEAVGKENLPDAVGIMLITHGSGYIVGPFVGGTYVHIEKLFNGKRDKSRFTDISLKI